MVPGEGGDLWVLRKLQRSYVNIGISLVRHHRCVRPYGGAAFHGGGRLPASRRCFALPGR